MSVSANTPHLAATWWSFVESNLSWGTSARGMPTFGDRSSTQFQLEYQIARFLRAQATAAPETSGSANRINQRRVERAGIDLIFFFSY